MRSGRRKILILLGVLLISGTIAVLLYFHYFGTTLEPVPGAYQNGEHHFAIRFPDGWELREGFMGTTAIGLRPKESFLSLFRETVAVTVEELDRELTRDEFFEKVLAWRKKNMTNFEHQEPERARLGSLDAIRLVYTHTYIFDIKALDYFIPVGKKGYIVTCSARPGTFQDFVDRFEEVCKTFMILENP
jgi:hypothetical protein